MTKRRVPTSRQIIEGDKSKLGKHVLQKKLESEPRAQDGLPPAPEHLSERARAAYEFWREQLELMMLDHRPDTQALEAAALHYARAVEADLVVAREGIIVDEPVYFQGKRLRAVFRKKKHPAVTVSNGAWALVKSFVCEFGLTPVSRTHLTVDRVRANDDDVEKLLNGPELTEEERRKLQ